MNHWTRVLAVTVALLAGLMHSPLADAQSKSGPAKKPSTAEKKKKDEANKKRQADRAQRAKTNKSINEQLGKDVAILMKRYADTNGFSGAILVAKDGTVIHKSGYGYADVKAKRKNDVNTLFDMGSIGKSFTAAAILKLEEQGKLKLADTLDKFFAYAPKDKAKITLTQILSHSSGLSMNYSPGEDVDFNDRDSCMRYFLSVPLSSSPGTKFEYSNANYYLAGAVVEIASKQDYESYVRKNLIEPAGLKSTDMCSAQSLDRKRDSRRYLDDQDFGSTADYPFTWGTRGVGYIITTVEDMLQWSLAIEDETVLSDESREKWFKAVLDDYALGWYVMDTGKGKAVWHGGAAPGARAIFTRFMAEDIVYIFMMNVQHREREIMFELRAELEQLLLASVK